MVIQTEFEFVLPKGFVDENGNLHRKGIMRLSTAADEILPLKDPRVQQQNYNRQISRVSRVITKLDDIARITPEIVEKMFSSDLANIQFLYNKINGDTRLKVTCPNCKDEFEVEITDLGE